MYTYACEACAHRFDVRQDFSDDALTECPQCQGRLRKQYGSIGVVFKGSGFYRTDSRATSDSASTSTGAGGKDAKTPAAAGSSSTTSSSESSSSGSSGSSSGSSSSTASAPAAASG